MDFQTKFSPFAGLTFINCFSAVMAHIEGWDVNEAFFWFDTMCGRSALRCRCDGAPSEWQKRICEHDFYDGGTAENIGFLFGLVGYEYSTITDQQLFRAAIADSLSRMRPVIAKVREDGFRVIVDMEDEIPVCPDFSDAQAAQDAACEWDRLECLYVIGDKAEPKHHLSDGIARIVHVLQESIEDEFWNGFRREIADGAFCAEKMHRLADAMWHTFNCHNLAEVFRARHFDGLSDQRLDAVCEGIDQVCRSTHDLAWALIELDRCTDWNAPASRYFAGMVDLTLEQMRKNDALLFGYAYEAAIISGRQIELR